MVEMSGRKRTERITEKDLQVLEFVARFGVVPREVVGLRAETARAVTAARERRLREAGLIEVLPGLGDSGRLCLCTRRGLGAIGREELPPTRFSPATLRHSAITAHLAAQLEGVGHRVLSEREIQARERAEAKRIYSARRGENGYHRPDLVILPPDTPSAPERSNKLSHEGWEPQGPSSPRTQGEAFAGRKGEPEDTGMRRAPVAPIAIEVELTAKAPRRLAEILRAWRRAVAYEQFGSVRYLCSPPVLPYLERALRGSMLAPAISVERLEAIDDKLTLSPQSLQRIAGRAISVAG